MEPAGCLPPDARARAPGTAGTRVGMELRRSLSPLLAGRSEVERLLERELEPQRSLRQDDRMAADVEPRPADSVRFAVVPSGREFDVLLFATPQDAQDAVPEVRASQVVELCSGVADSMLPEADARTPGQDDPGPAADL